MTDRERLETMIREALNDGWQHEAPRLADALLAKGVTVPPAPAPPTPTWWPSAEATAMLIRYWRADPQPLPGPFLLRLYAHLHRDRVAAVATLYIANGEEIVRLKGSHVASRTAILSLADDGTGT